MSEKIASLLGKEYGSTLLIDDLHAIGMGQTDFHSEEQLGFISDHEVGISIALKDKAFLTKQTKRTNIFVVIAIHLYSEGFEDFSCYRGPLPHGVNFLDKREVVRQKMGPPSDSGGGNKGIGGRPWPLWDRYIFPGHSLRFQFKEGELLSMITYSAKTVVQ